MRITIKNYTPQGYLPVLNTSKIYVTCCAVGLRGYLAERIPKQNGFKVFNLSGGWATWKLFHP
jgi:rhodanese-related sulfurtransferase